MGYEQKNRIFIDLSGVTNMNLTDKEMIYMGSYK